jgi:hypothetical protein
MDRDKGIALLGAEILSLAAETLALQAVCTQVLLQLRHWRSRTGHRAAQLTGREGVFRDYRLRVAAVVRDYGMSERRQQAPADSRAIYDVLD